MEKNQKQKAVLFVDIVDSTTYYEKLGDQNAQAVMSDAMSLLSDIVMQYNGVVIKTIGDAVMATFDSADAVAGAALFMQQIFQANQVSEHVSAGEVRIRVGLNVGDVVVDQDDVFGNAVIIASRVASIAKENQILTTKDTVEILPEEQARAARFIIKKELKGLPDEFEIYELLPVEGDANVTTIDGEGMYQDEQEVVLVLTYQDKTFVLNKDKHKFKIGRSDDNDIIVQSAKASRQHITLEFNAGKYLLTDRSANGSYVLQEDGVMLKVHMDHLTLYQKGKIFLGQRDDLENVISFSHEVKV